MWHAYINAATLDEAVQVLAEKPGQARIVAGATDLILELERGVRKGVDILVDITRVPGQDQICLDEEGIIHMGPLVTHNHCVGSKLIREQAFPLAQAAWEVGSPQIRNRGTIAGNLITASPANDTITPLMALGARLTLRSKRGERVVPLQEFYTGVRRTVMQPDELLVDIAFPALKAAPREAGGGYQQGTFIKYALRRAQAISLVNVAIVLTRSGERIEAAAVTLGAVAPTIIHAAEAEAFLAGKVLDEDTARQAAELAAAAARPISDIRSSAGYRKAMVRVITRRALQALAQHSERQAFPVDPVLLRGRPKNGNGKTVPLAQLTEQPAYTPGGPIVATINGRPYCFPPDPPDPPDPVRLGQGIGSGQGKNLLRLLREDAALEGTKEGCAEGECGACTVFLDGVAVMSCMVPAPRAHGAQIITVEGLAQEGHLHPVQQAFIDHGAVQCGYCTPGFLMSAAKLLEERSSPTYEQICQAMTGNLCRCTGYYKIIEAVEGAARAAHNPETTMSPCPNPTGPGGGPHGSI